MNAKIRRTRQCEPQVSHRDGDSGCDRLRGISLRASCVQANTYKDLMQHYADVAATQGYPPSWISEQLTKSGPEYGIPANAIITPVSVTDNARSESSIRQSDRVSRLSLQLRIRSHGEEHRLPHVQIDFSHRFTEIG